ncbi:MAG: metal-dependent hydrolase [Candidatus Kerfeldbacteria bacterium]
MLFAHAPLGFLAAWTSKPFWKKFGITKKFQYKLLVVGFFAGVIPDLDLIYFYFINAEGSHRNFPSHAPILYLVVIVALCLIFWFLKKYKAFLVTFVIGTSIFSHLIADMIVAQIKLFYPFSAEFYGLADLGIELISNNLSFVNYLIEGTIFFFFFYVLLWMFVKKRQARIILTALLILIYVGGVATITYANKRLYHAPYGGYFSDLDNDGIVNYADRDIDGDGQLNIEDLDADGDGDANVLKIIQHAEFFFNGIYDPTEGGIMEIPQRLGFTANNNFIMQLYAAAGIHLQTEMAYDYEQHPDGYLLPPSDPYFDRDNENIKVWLDHMGWLQTGEQLNEGWNQIGDILYFESGHVTVVTGFDMSSNALGLDIHKNRSLQERYIDDLIDLEGPIVARGKVLDPAPLYGTPTEDSTEEKSQ